jgi:hypothetical protein
VLLDETYLRVVDGLPTNTSVEVVDRRVRLERLGAEPEPPGMSAIVEAVGAMLPHRLPGPVVGGRRRDRHVRRVHPHLWVLLGFYGAFRRSELSALDVDQLLDDAGGVVVELRRTKTSNRHAVRAVALSEGVPMCPTPYGVVWWAGPQSMLRN